MCQRCCGLMPGLTTCIDSYDLSWSLLVWHLKGIEKPAWEIIIMLIICQFYHSWL